MLQLSNSAYYGFPRRIATVRDAIVLLGFRAVRSATLASCVIQAVPTGSTGTDARAFWRYSVLIGMVSELIAQAEFADSEEAFTAGVLHNIGRLALDQHYPALMRAAQRRAATQHVALLDAERELCGFTDPEVGSALALQWNLPESLVEATGRHRESLYAIDDPRSSLGLVVRARALASSAGLWDGIEPATETAPPAEWNGPPLQRALARAGGMEGLLERVDAFLSAAVG
jgi:HD-like signal output (HDOD) protein